MREGGGLTGGEDAEERGRRQDDLADDDPAGRRIGHVARGSAENAGGARRQLEDRRRHQTDPDQRRGLQVGDLEHERGPRRCPAWRF